MKKENEHFETGRERGWLLIKTNHDKEEKDKIKAAATRIYENWKYQGDEEKEDQAYVVMRADVVSGDYDIVIPIDAPKGKLDKVIGDIEADDGEINYTKVLKVSHHNPAITYLAHGFVSRAEFDKADKDHKHPDKHGRIMRKSPGDNPWG